MSKLSDYPFEIRPLSLEEGGGFLISYPDFAECILDGGTIEGALKNGQDALRATIAALEAKDLPVPVANSGGTASGKFVARVPKTIHAQLTTRGTVSGLDLALARCGTMQRSALIAPALHLEVIETLLAQCPGQQP